MHRTQNLTVSAADTDEPRLVTPADILRGAALYLEIHGWTQRENYSNQGGPFPKACAFGAMGMAAHGRLITVPTDSGSGVRDCRRALAFFACYLDDVGATVQILDEWATEPANIFDWNDRDEQTADQVITMLRAAADEWTWTHATDEQVAAYTEGCLADLTEPTVTGFVSWLDAR